MTHAELIRNTNWEDGDNPMNGAVPMLLDSLEVYIARHGKNYRPEILELLGLARELHERLLGMGEQK